eukprot:5076356-Pyramimonas_sp.AAC.1
MPGDKVKLSPGYKECRDAAKGKLKEGEVGTVLKDDGSDLPYKVEAPNGEEWWYTSGALVLVEKCTSRGLQVGDAVKLSPVYKDCGDAANGPLKEGE